ncbi:hypothetical protein ID866_10760, partial [Astraeus odoratus]
MGAAETLDGQKPLALNYCFITFSDNSGIVEGWWNNRHHNHQTNKVFKCIHNLLLQANHIQGVQTWYVPSECNPTDGPSQGVYLPVSLLLPQVPLPQDLYPYIIDVTDLPNFASSQRPPIVFPSTMHCSKLQAPRKRPTPHIPFMPTHHSLSQVFPDMQTYICKPPK